MKTAELTGSALDWAVAIAFNPAPEWGDWKPSTNWAQGGPIIERERIDIDTTSSQLWRAVNETTFQTDKPHYYGPTPLIAAMRCYVASKLGDEVQIPEGLK